MQPRLISFSLAERIIVHDQDFRLFNTVIFTSNEGDYYLMEPVGSTSAHIFIKGDSAIGIICQSDGTCNEAQPTRSIHEDGVTWSL